jgi:hypothetical protein
MDTMYRDDLAATHARVEALQVELATARSQAVQDNRQLDRLTSELEAMRETIARMGGRAPGTPIFPPRGNAVLALGICSLVVCSILGPIAWALGNSEMRRIRRGETPPDAESATIAGRVCGIIGTAILAVVTIVVIVMIASLGRQEHFLGHGF